MLCHETQENCTRELQRWIDDEWLLPYDEQTYGPAKGLIPLMAVVQRNKGKVRQVMDFRELNMHGANVFVVDMVKA